jgi:hypothetical protein
MGVVLHKSVETRCAPRIFHWGVTQRLYTFYVYFKNCYKNHVISITVTQHCLQLHLYTYENNCMFQDSITLTYLLVILKFC